jgi:hypothetical protein
MMSGRLEIRSTPLPSASTPLSRKSPAGIAPGHRLPRRRSSAQSCRRVDDLQSGENLRAELLRPAAIIGKGCQRLDRLEVAHIAAEIGFEAPECRQDGTRNAVFLLNLRKQSCILFEQRLRLVETAGRDELGLEL